MIKPEKGANNEVEQGHDEDLVKKQRKLLVNSLVKDFYPYKFSAGQMIKEREASKTRGS